MNFLIEAPVKQVYATMSSILDQSDFEDHAEIMISFDEDITGILEVNWLTPYKRRQIEITGTDGIITIDYIDQSIEVYGKFAQDIQIKPVEPLSEELNSFLCKIEADVKLKRMKNLKLLVKMGLKLSRWFLQQTNHLKNTAQSILDRI